MYFWSFLSDKVDEWGNVLPGYRHEISELVELARDLGPTVYCAPEYDGWKINNLSPGDAYQSDTEQLDKADVFIGYIDPRPSIGVAMEAMRAALQRKPLQIVTHKANPVYMLRGMIDSQDFASHVVCPDQPNRLVALPEFLSKYRMSV